MYAWYCPYTLAFFLQKFVVIKTTPKKTMVLTEHQREKMREQRYVEINTIKYDRKATLDKN